MPSKQMKKLFKNGWKKARNELEVVADYQYAVVNTTPKEAARRIKNIIKKTMAQ